MSRNAWLTVLVLTLGLSSIQSSARAQEAGEAEEGETKNDIGVFVGALSNLETNETGPGVGFDYTREVTDKLGFVVFAEWANAGEREAAFGGGIEWRPGGDIKIFLALGVIVERTDEDETSDEDDKGVSGGRLNDLSVGFNWYPVRRARVMLNYILAKRSDAEPVSIFQGRLQVAF